MSGAIATEVGLQNALMLARLLGGEAPDQAFALLNVAIEIAYAPSFFEQRLFALELQAQLQRTIADVRLIECDMPSVKVSVHGGPFICTVLVTRLRTIITASHFLPSEPFVAPDGPSRIIAASYTCAFVVARIVNRQERISTPDPLVVERSSLPKFNHQEPINLGETWLLGAGAVGCAVLWALREIPVSGRLHIVDPKTVTAGNLNRQILFSESDIGDPKAVVAATIARTLLPSLELAPHVETFQDAFTGQSVSRVLVGMDSREVRQALQRTLPMEVFDASTTGAIEVLFHYNALSEKLACLECIYPTRTDKLVQARHVAEGLGLTLGEVQAPFITPAVAAKLALMFPEVKADTLVGRAISSIYREMCSAAVLRAPGGEQFLAPFSFVSILAGTLLVMHLISKLQGTPLPYNLWTVSAWAAPFADARELRGQRAGCVCTTSAYRSVAERRLG